MPWGPRPQAPDVRDFQTTPESQRRPSVEPRPHSLVSQAGKTALTRVPRGLSPRPPVASDASVPATGDSGDTRVCGATQSQHTARLLLCHPPPTGTPPRYRTSLNCVPLRPPAGQPPRRVGAGGSSGSTPGSRNKASFRQDTRLATARSEHTSHSAGGTGRDAREPDGRTWDMETGEQPRSPPSTAGSGLPVSGTEPPASSSSPVGHRWGQQGTQALRGPNPPDAGKALTTAPAHGEGCSMRVSRLKRAGGRWAMSHR